MGFVYDPASNPATGYKISDIDSTEGNQYFGYVSKGGAWYIMNLTATAARYCKGSSNYITNWGNRTGLEYGYFHNIF